MTHASGMLSLDGLARLAAVGERRSFAAGDRLMKQGEPAESLFVILAGQVSVVREHPDLSEPVQLAALGPGEVVGEMGLLDGESRSATVTALEGTVAMEIGKDQLAEIVERFPEVYGTLVRVLSRRLRRTDELAAQIKSGTTQ